MPLICKVATLLINQIHDYNLIKNLLELYQTFFFFSLLGTKETLDWLVVVFALIGKGSGLGGTYICQIYSAELYPTVIRYYWDKYS